MRAIPLGLAAMLLSGAALAQTDAPHTAPGRSSITDAPVGANATPGTAPGAVTGLGNTARDSGRPGTTVQGTPQGPSSINDAPVGANATGAAR